MTEAERNILADLTDSQRAAVTHGDGPLLVLAAAGSGKTRVITRRVAWLIARGTPGGHILAVTFTNKAANEMKKRIDSLLADRPADDWSAFPTVSTFHSFAARMLRIHHARARLPAEYVIYDQADRMRAIRQAIEQAGYSPEAIKPDRVDAVISRAKNQLQDAAAFAAAAGGRGFADRRFVDIFTAYEKLLAQARALDFDDLLLRLAGLLHQDAEFRSLMSDRYRHILIDEYQDTNAAQYQIVRYLCRPRNNVCATGDPDQSIYGWRGADLNNILRFERDFPGTTVVRLEQNYRSTQRILEAADGLIRHNRRRKHKELWTANAPGEKVAVVRCTAPEAEAEFLADRVEQVFAAGGSYSQVAVFMRLNALTRVVEQVFVRRGIPYQIARGVAFYSRKEIKDATSYLRLMINPHDRAALERVVNVPPRGIGQTTVDRLVEFAEGSGVSVWEACRRVGQRAGQPPGDGPLPALGRGASAVGRFVELIERMAAAVGKAPGIRKAVETVLADSGLERMYREDESASANLGELLSAAEQFDQDNNFQASLSDYLRGTALVGDTDLLDDSLGAVKLMTLHAAKGLEFPVVFIIGCESGLIPYEREGTVRDEEEERRLLFVGITRAQRQLTLTHAAERMLHGLTTACEPSPFLDELPAKAVELTDLAGPDWPASYRPSAGRGQSHWRQRPWSARERPGDLGWVRRAGREPAEPEAEADDRAEAGATSPAGRDWQVGSLIRHARFGIGRVVRLSASGPYTKATIDFRKGGLKAIILEMAPIERLLD